MQVMHESDYLLTKYYIKYEIKFVALYIEGYNALNVHFV